MVPNEMETTQVRLTFGEADVKELMIFEREDSAATTTYIASFESFSFSGTKSSLTLINCRAKISSSLQWLRASCHLKVWALLKLIPSRDLNFQFESEKSKNFRDNLSPWPREWNLYQNFSGGPLRNWNLMSANLGRKICRRVQNVLRLLQPA